MTIKGQNDLTEKYQPLDIPSGDINSEYLKTLKAALSVKVRVNWTWSDQRQRFTLDSLAAGCNAFEQKTGEAQSSNGHAEYSFDNEADAAKFRVMAKLQVFVTGVV